MGWGLSSGSLHPPRPGFLNWPPAAASCAGAWQIMLAVLALWSSECYLSRHPGWHLCLAGHAVPLLTSSHFPWQVPLWHCQ